MPQEASSDLSTLGDISLISELMFTTEPGHQKMGNFVKTIENLKLMWFY